MKEIKEKTTSLSTIVELIHRSKYMHLVNLGAFVVDVHEIYCWEAHVASSIDVMND
jgi:hypothetical protein